MQSPCCSVRLPRLTSRSTTRRDRFFTGRFIALRSWFRCLEARILPPLPESSRDLRSTQPEKPSPQDGYAPAPPSDHNSAYSPPQSLLRAPRATPHSPRTGIRLG